MLKHSMLQDDTLSTFFVTLKFCFLLKQSVQTLYPDNGSSELFVVMPFHDTIILVLPLASALRLPGTDVGAVKIYRCGTHFYFNIFTIT